MNFWASTGVRPALGKLFNATDDQAQGANPVVALSHNFWIRRFGGDPSILNQTIRTNRQAFTVIGVSGAGFDGLSPGRAGFSDPLHCAPRFGWIAGFSVEQPQ